jgi:hypothetical protein
MNAAFGQLLIDIPVKSLIKNLKIKSLPRTVRQSLCLVVKHNERYYNNTDYYKSVNELITKTSKGDYE